MENKVLIVSLDVGSSDMPVLTVSENTGVSLKPLNLFVGDQALMLYDKLVGNMTKWKY